MDNSVTLAGNLTRDPDLRHLASGRATATAAIAVNRRWQQNGEWTEAVSFFDVVAWGGLAENFAASCRKGTRIVVAGRLAQRSYDTKDGGRRHVVEVIADDIGPSMRWAIAVVERVHGSTEPTAGTEAEPTAGAEAGTTAGAEAGPTAGTEAGPTAGAEAGPTAGAEAEPTPETVDAPV